MTIQTAYNSKIRTNLSGEVIDSSASASSKILDINPAVIQFHNRITKSSTDNKISRLMDSAQNKVFYAESGDEPNYNYVNQSIDFVNHIMKCNQSALRRIEGRNEFTVHLWLEVKRKSAISLMRNENELALKNFAIHMTGAAGAVQFRIYDSADTLYSISFGASLDLDGIYCLTASRKGNIFTAYKDGIKQFSSTLDIDIKSNCDNTILQPTTENYFRVVAENVGYDADVIKIPEKHALWYKRYSNKDGKIKGHLTSRNLDVAVINSADEITSIYDEIGNVFTSSGTNAVKWTPKGFYFQGSAYLQRTGFLIGTDDFFIGRWVSNANSNDAVISQNSNVIISKVSGNYEVNGNVIGAFSTNKNEYPWALRKSGVLYYGINGVLKGSVADTTNYTLSDYLLGSNAFVGYMDDDLLPITDSIYDPTGYSIDDKVFKPPMRKSLDPNFVQYPIP